MSKAKILTTYSDGGARGNPGPAAIGVVVVDGKGSVVREFGRCIGEATNNQAEYQALLAALTVAGELGASEVNCRLDSELVVKQMRQEYRVKDAGLQPLFLQVWNQSQKFFKVNFTHVPREQNTRADALLNQALDQAGT